MTTPSLMSVENGTDGYKANNFTGQIKEKNNGNMTTPSLMSVENGTDGYKANNFTGQIKEKNNGNMTTPSLMSVENGTDGYKANNFTGQIKEKRPADDLIQQHHYQADKSTSENQSQVTLNDCVYWKSLIIPACLPITTDYFPGKKNLTG
ncbi:uncharacterized protein LOC122850724 [Aphidius gifuensis]|uniref:uncharacterized protein LOC122850724 n=1 Tax=Aphidius gifuensis TaxID=684658 RepID=UPI001CDD77F8|nr:uncharacterized protein LOC122850724 [Aphidius gifuensis]